MDLIERAYNLIEDEEYSKAAEIGKSLISKSELEGYLILTDIAHQKENIKECVEILKQGIEQNKNYWKFWMRLGNYQSDLEKFEEAEYSFDRALYMNHADQSIIKLNKAILLRRTKRYDEAVKLAKECWEEYPVNSFCFELDVLNELEKYDEIISKIDEPKFDDEYEQDLETFSRALFYIAKAYYKSNDNKKAEKYLNDSLDLDRSNENSLWLRRVLFGESNSNNKYFQIMINGDYKDEETKGSEMEFFSWYDVIAKDLDTALQKIKEFEPLELDKESFKIEEYEIVNESTTDPDGIYRTTGFSICQKE